MDRALDVIRKIDHVILYENLPHELGFDCDMPHVAASPSEPCMTDEIAKWFCETSPLDIELYERIREELTGTALGISTNVFRRDRNSP